MNYNKDNNFLCAIDFTLSNEGGYSNIPQDKGRETKFGISKKSYPNLDISKLTLNTAKQIYFKDYWIPARCHRILNHIISIKLFDLAVHIGVKMAHCLIIRALGEKAERLNEDIILMINSVRDNINLLYKLKIETIKYYCRIVLYNTEQHIFLIGWLNRLNKMPSLNNQV